MATYPPEVAPLLEALFAGVREALGDNLLGFYLRGSLALGGFDPATSDVDILVVTERPVSDAEFTVLAELHERIPATQNEFRRIYEVSYVDRASLKRFATGERRHPTVGADWPFLWTEHGDNFVLELWIVREHGVVLVGPDPKTLIDPMSTEELRAAVVALFRTWREDWADGATPPAIFESRHYQAFAIETVCRALYTVQFGELPTKPHAAAWAVEALPEPWRGLVQWSQKYRADETVDPTKISDIKRFMQWADLKATA